MRFLKSYRRNFLQFLFILLSMLALVTPLAWFAVSHPDDAQSMSVIIAQNSFLFMGFRWLVIALVFIFWRSFVHCVGIRRHWPDERIKFWQSQRFKITLWLTLFELVLCDSLLLKLVHMLEG